MRDLILKMSISIDGFVGRPGGQFDWLFNSMDPAATAWTVNTVWNASLHIMGSRTFHDMAAFWPTSTEVFAPPMNQIPKAVFSRQGPAILKNRNTTAALHDANRANAKTGQCANLQPGAESWANPYVASGDLALEIAKLKAEKGKPIVAHGGASFGRSLVALGLVGDSELAAPRPLRLTSSTAFPAGSVAQLYRPA